MSTELATTTKFQRGDVVRPNEEALKHNVFRDRSGEIVGVSRDGQTAYVVWEGLTTRSPVPVTWLQIAEARSSDTVDDLVVIASNVDEFHASQRKLIERIRAKQQTHRVESAELEKTVELAAAASIDVEPVRRQIGRLTSRIGFLERTAAALEAGFVIVPNFDCRVIAIRVKENRLPRRKPSVSSYGNPTAREEKADLLPPGQGKYVDPQPTQQTEREVKIEGGKSTTVRTAVPIELLETLELPADFLKPKVIQRTTAAAAMKIFDEIAVSPSWPNRGKDPMVLGRIRGRDDGYGHGRTLTFLVAWFIDTASI